MLFDRNRYTVMVRKLVASGDHEALKSYLEKEFQTLQEAKLAGASCGCCGQTACRAPEEELAWKRNRLQGLLLTGSELANCCCEYREWDECFALYRTLEDLLSSAGLEGTEAYARVLLNHAYASMEHGDAEQALAQAQDAEACLAKAGSQDKTVWTMLYELLAAVHRALGHADEAAAATEKAAGGGQNA